MKALISFAETSGASSTGLVADTSFDVYWNLELSMSKSLFRSEVLVADEFSCLGESYFSLLNLAGVYLKSLEDFSKLADPGGAEIELNKLLDFCSVCIVRSGTGKSLANLFSSG
mgnify:FL=1